MRWLRPAVPAPSMLSRRTRVLGTKLQERPRAGLSLPLSLSRVMWLVTCRKVYRCIMLVHRTSAPVVSSYRWGKGRVVWRNYSPKALQLSSRPGTRSWGSQPADSSFHQTSVPQVTTRRQWGACQGNSSPICSFIKGSSGGFALIISQLQQRM